jgi:hypothetical protein
MSTECAVRHTEVHSDLLGHVTRVEAFGRTYFAAAGRCIGNYRGDNFDYGVSITPPDQHPDCSTGFATEAEALEAITTWKPSFRGHANDHNHARREAGLELRPLPLPLSMQ